MVSDRLKERPFIAFDVETTGLFAGCHRLLEIGGVRSRLASNEVETFAELIDPGSPIPPGVTKVHGITDDMVRGCAKVNEVVARWLGFVGGGDAVLVAHNADFDMGFLALEMDKAGLARPDNPVCDTLSLSDGRLPGLANHKLQTVADALGAREPQAHRALGDALLVREVFERLCALAPPVSTMQELARAAEIFFFEDCDVGVVEPPPGYEVLGRAIRDDGPVTMVYSGGTRGARPRKVTPRALVRRGGRVYLLAHCHIDGFEKTFRLDRIVAFEASGAGS